MRHWLIGLILGALLVLSAYAYEVSVEKDGSVFMKLSPEEAQTCVDGDGCLLVTTRAFRNAVAKACEKSI